MKADNERTVLLPIALILGFVGTSALLLAVLWEPDHDASNQEALREFCLQLWPFCLTTAIGLFVYDRWLRHIFVEELVRVSGPAIVDALLPATVLKLFLARIYGDMPQNYDVLTGLLGGQGVEETGRDLTISSRTTVHYTLAGESPTEYVLTSEVEYTFRHPVDDHEFVFFATCDSELRDRLVLACDQSLFETWYVPLERIFEESVDRMLQSAKVGIRYQDPGGREHSSDPRHVTLTEVPQSQWQEHLSIFRQDIGALRKRDPEEFSGRLRIFKTDLRHALAQESIVLDRIASLKLVSATVQSKADGYCYWTAPYPCYTSMMTFDASEFSVGEDGEYMFRLVPFVLHGHLQKDEWTSARDLVPLNISSWLLPGHGAALLWKSAPLEEPLQ